MFGRIPSLLGCLCAIVGGCAAPIVPAGNQFDGTYQGDGRLTRGFGYVCAVPVHSLMVARHDAGMRSALNGAAMNLPDGRPLVWALNLLVVGDRDGGVEQIPAANCPHRAPAAA